MPSLHCHTNKYDIGLFSENLNTYFYEFSRPDFESSRPAWVDTDHGDDLFFIFGSPYMEDMAVNYKYTKEEMKLSQIMMKYWTNFAKYGWVLVFYLLPIIWSILMSFVANKMVLYLSCL